MKATKLLLKAGNSNDVHFSLAEGQELVALE